MNCKHAFRHFRLSLTVARQARFVTAEAIALLLKVDITLIGVSRYDATLKKAVKEFLTNENEQYSSAKSPIGMFSEQYIPNDLGYVSDKINEYYG